MHPEVGLGVAEGAGIAALRPFFLSLRLPLTVTRREQVPVTVAVFNYLEECLNVSMHESQLQKRNILQSTS